MGVTILNFKEDIVIVKFKNIRFILIKKGLKTQFKSKNIHKTNFTKRPKQK